MFVFIDSLGVYVVYLGFFGVGVCFLTGEGKKKVGKEESEALSLDIHMNA